MGLSLDLKPLIGDHLEHTLEAAYLIALKLNLSSADFEFNGTQYCVFQEGTAIGFESNGSIPWKRTAEGGWVKR